MAKIRHFCHSSQVRTSQPKRNLPEFSAIVDSTKLKFTCFVHFYNFQSCPIINFVQFSILSNFSICSILFNFVQFSILFNFVQFSILSILFNFQFCPIFNFVNFVQFSILSNFQFIMIDLWSVSLLQLLKFLSLFRVKIRILGLNGSNPVEIIKQN